METRELSEDRARRWRALSLVVYAAVFAAWQTAEILTPAAGHGLAALFGICTLSLGALTLGVWRANPSTTIAALMDELWEEHRRRALVVGYASTGVGIALLLAAVSCGMSCSLLTALRSLLIVAVATPLCAFSLQELS